MLKKSKYFSWHTALAGLIASVAVMFMVNQIWAIVSIAIAIILSAVSHYTAPRVAWGSLSQALIFHQVRKYALKININDTTVDTWRPGILFLCSDIMPNLESLLFLNDLKKSGLFVIGHVNIGTMGLGRTFIRNKFLDENVRSSIRHYGSVEFEAKVGFLD